MYVNTRLLNASFTVRDEHSFTVTLTSVQKRKDRIETDSEETSTGNTRKANSSAHVCMQAAQSSSWVDVLRTAGPRPSPDNDTSSGNS